MNRLSRLLKTRCPGWFTEATVFLQLNVAPAPFYRRRAALLRHAGSPTSVMHGPFRGLKYTRYAADKALAPRLLGTYECETHAAVEHLCAAQPDLIVIAGAGEGYYAAGLAMRVSAARVVAYDGFKWAQHLLRQMLKLNHLQDRVEVRGLVNPADLERVLSQAQRPAVICDVDGYEQQLIDPAAVPSLRRALILLELHDHLAPGITAEMRRRFSSTASIVHMPERERTLSDLPPGLNLPLQEALWGINELQFRGVRQSWMYLAPHAVTAQHPLPAVSQAA